MRRPPALLRNPKPKPNPNPNPNPNQVRGTCDGHPHCFVLRTGLRDFVFCPADAVHPDQTAREWVQLLVHAKALQLMADADESASARPHGADRANWRTHEEATPTTRARAASSSSTPTYTGL